MGELSVVTGRIVVNTKEQLLKNLQVISELPSESDGGYPTFTKEMFCQNTLPGKGDYVFGFARGYKNIESGWGYWIDEFEKILRKMEWDSVNVFLETEFFGTHQYMWMNKYYNSNKEVKRPNEYELVEKEEWYFGKGHRNFFGRLDNWGWGTDLEEMSILDALATSIDASLEGKVATMKMFKEANDEYKLLGNANGLKQLISNLSKLYLKELQKENPDYQKYDFGKVESLLHPDSPVKISALTVLSYTNNTNWVYHFVDKMYSDKP